MLRKVVTVYRVGPSFLKRGHYGNIGFRMKVTLDPANEKCTPYMRLSFSNKELWEMQLL